MLDMTRSEKYFLCLIALITLSLRVIFINHKSLWPDEALYLYIGRNLISNPLDLKGIQGDVFFLNPPLFLYSLSLLLRIDILDPALLARSLTILMDTGTVIITFFMARALFGTSVGLISASLVSVNPLHWSTSTRILTDVPLTFFVYLAIFMLIKGKKVLFYLFSAFSVATKYPAAPLFLVPLITWDRVKKYPHLWLFIFLAGLSAVILFVIHPVRTEHEWLNYFLVFFKIPDFREIYRESKYFLDLVVCLFFLVGLSYALRKKAFSPLLVWVILFGIARLFLPWLAFRYSRYSLPLYPGIIIFAAFGGVTAFRFIQKRLPRRTPFLCMIFGLILLYVISVSAFKGYRATRSASSGFIGFEAVRDFFDKGSVHVKILTSSPNQVKYMAPELAVYDLAAESTPEEAFALIREKDLRYVLLDRWSPHQPGWALDYFAPRNGYYPVHMTRHLLILETGRDRSNKKSP